MYRRMLAVAVLALLVVLLAGCLPPQGGGGLGEGRGVLARGDFDPFGGGRAPVDLLHFTAPREGRYQVTMASGQGDNVLRNPMIMVMRGRIPARQQAFMRAYNNGHGVIEQNSGSNIATVAFRATGGDNFTIVFTSRGNDLGRYDYRVTAGWQQ